jgi:sugar/nucleoside kinase (ribokinase family)
MNSSGDYIFAPSLQLPDGYIKGTVGAGDAFCAGTLYSLYHNYDMEYALKFGAGSAACNLSHLTSVDGMKNIRGIREVIGKYSSGQQELNK